MKKLILLFSVFTLMLTSCSKDDKPTQDPIIGTWTWYQGFEDGVEYTLDECDLQDKLVINGDGTYNSTTHYTNADNTCGLDSEEVGTWENKGNGLYLFTSNGEIFAQEITFKDNTFIIEVEEGTSSYKDIYIKN